MLKNKTSFASLLVKQISAMPYGHGWIIGADGKRWQPSRSQADLLADLPSRKKEDLWLLNLCRKLRR